MSKELKIYNSVKFPGLTGMIIVAMLLGVLTGIVFGNNVSFLGLFSKFIIQLIKALAIPLVFLVIIETLLTTVISRTHVLSLFFILLINSFLAATIGLSLSNFFQAGREFNFSQKINSIPDSQPLMLLQKKINLSEIISGYIPESFAKPFADNNVIAIVLLAILIGTASRVVLSQNSPEVITLEALKKSLRYLIKVFEKILSWLILLVPLAVYGAISKTVGEYGFEPLKGLLAYLGIGLGGLLIHCSVVYSTWIFLICKIKVRDFFLCSKEALINGIGTNSSLATLPLTLICLDKLNISKTASSLGACVATNLNNDGILLYETMAVLFVAQAYGIELSLGQQMLTAMLCVLAAVGIAGIPEAGIVSLSVVLTTANLPLDILPVLLTVDWIIARARTVTNVLSDMTVSIALDRIAANNSHN